MNVLTQRNLGGLDAVGTIRINGTVVQRDFIRKIAAYVEQDDLFIGTMTVLEHLQFTVIFFF